MAQPQQAADEYTVTGRPPQAQPAAAAPIAATAASPSNDEFTVTSRPPTAAFPSATPPSPLSNEAPEDYLNRLMDWTNKNPKDAATYRANALSNLKDTSISAAPYAAGATASALSGNLELMPWWAALLTKAALAGATGGLTKAATNKLTGQPTEQDVGSTAAQVGGGEGFGTAAADAVKGAVLISRLAKGGMIPEDIMKYLIEHGLNPTTGERLGPGIISAGENVISGTAVGTKSASAFMATRQAALKAEASRIADTLATSGMAAPETPARGTSVEALQRMADGLSKSTLADQASQFRIGDAALPDNMTPADSGRQIIAAVHGQFDASNAAERSLYNIINQQIASRGVTVAGDTTAKLAADMLNEAHQVQSVLGKAPAAEGPLYDSLYALSGGAYKDSIAAANFGGLAYQSLDPAKKLAVDRIAAQVPQSVPFDTFWKARQEFGARIGSLEASGAIDSKKLAAVNRLYDAMTADMMSSLPADIKPLFQMGMDFTKQQKADFGASIVKSMLHPDKPIAAEKVVDTILRQGNETDTAALLKVVGGDRQAMSTLQSATESWLRKNITSPEATLKLLDDRPQLRSIMGPGYDSFVSAIKTQAAKEMSQTDINYNSFLGNLAKGQDKSTIIDKVVTSPYYASQVGRLVPVGSPVRAQLATDMIMHIFDSSTEGGSYSLPGAHLNGDKLLQSLRSNEESLVKFIPQASIDAYKSYAQSTIARDAFSQLLEAATGKGAFSSDIGNFNPQQFAGKWSELRPTIARAMSPADLATIDKFAAASKFLTLTPNVTANAARFGTLRQIGLLTNIPIQFLLGSSPVISLTSEAAAVLGPKALMAAWLNPDFAEFMANGIRMPGPYVNNPARSAATNLVLRAGKFVARDMVYPGTKTTVNNAGPLLNMAQAVAFLNSMSDSGRQIQGPPPPPNEVRQYAAPVQ